LWLARTEDEQPRDARLPIALLCDYYEHGIEHAPPRDPSGSMQRREQFYRTPPEPIDFLCAQLKANPADEVARRLLLSWQSEWMMGNAKVCSVPSAGQLAKAVEGSSLNDLAILDAGRGFNWLVGDEFAAQFYKAALDKAFRVRKDVRAGDPSCLDFLHGLDQTRALWRVNDYEGLELRFRFARRFNLPLSVESRRAGCLLVDALYYQNRIDEALNVLGQVQAEDDRVGDLGTLDRSDFYEMDYLHGFLLQGAGRNAAALPYLKKVVIGGDHAQGATYSLFKAYLALEQFGSAEATLKGYIEKFRISGSEEESLRLSLEQARQATEGRTSIAGMLKN
jgi:hypothetical protein